MNWITKKLKKWCFKKLCEDDEFFSDVLNFVADDCPYTDVCYSEFLENLTNDEFIESRR